MDVNAEYLRRRKLAANKNAVLTEEGVARIKRQLIQGFRPRDIARANGVGTETIRRISRGETWDWVEPAPEQAATTSIPTIDEAVKASQERVLQMLEKDKPAAGEFLLDKALEEANKIRNPAGLDKFLGGDK